LAAPGKKNGGGKVRRARFNFKGKGKGKEKENNLPMIGTQETAAIGMGATIVNFTGTEGDCTQSLRVEGALHFRFSRKKGKEKKGPCDSMERVY